MGRLGDHPRVLSIHDLGEDNGQPYTVLPLMPGGNVGTLLANAEDHKLPLEQAIDLASQICRSLEFAHSNGIVIATSSPVTSGSPRMAPPASGTSASQWP